MENIYLKEGKKEKCNGCKLCAMICPVNAIEMIEDNEGFEYPIINKEKCVNCGKCKNICSNFNDAKMESKAYMAINKNKSEVQKSSSGGMFIVLAKYVISKKGIVFGVKYNDNLDAVHDYAQTLEECKAFQGSKYVKSDVRNSYKEAKEFLENNRYVLFTGTPCQCSALRVYLNKEYEKLITCEVICHATPSPKVFRKYKSELENKYNKKIKNISFRDKSNGWHDPTPIIELEDGTKKKNGTYSIAFMNELINRPSCYSCEFCGPSRISDFTIGDFWGVEKVLPNIEDDNTGISVILVNNNMAQKIFVEVSKDINYQEISVENAFKYNHNKNEMMHKDREKFFDDLDKMSVIKNMDRFVKEKLPKRVIRSIKVFVRMILKKLNLYQFLKK